MKTLALAALCGLFCACADRATAPVATPAPNFARQFKQVAGITIAPTSATIAIGGTVTLTATYVDRKGVPVTTAPVTMWGCRPNGCFSLVQVLPALGGGTATITGLAAGTVTIYASAGLDHDGDGVVDFANTTVVVQ